MIRRDEAIRERLKEDGIRHESSEFEIKMINLKSFKAAYRFVEEELLLLCLVLIDFFVNNSLRKFKR